MKISPRLRIFVVISLFVVLAIAGFIFCSVRKDHIIYSDIEIEVLNPVLTIELPNTSNSEHGFTCTGLSFDKTNNRFIGGGYGRELPDKGIIRPLIIVLSEDFEIVEEIPIPNEMNNKEVNLQGVGYDTKEGIIWFTDSERIYGYDINERLVRHEIYDKTCIHPNGVAYDETDDSVWVLYFDGDLIEYNKNGKKIKTIKAGYDDQDQITVTKNKLYMTVGADYSGEENYLLEYDRSGKICKKYRLEGSYAVEGCCIVEGKLYVFNDGYYHSAKINRNIVQVYTFYD